MPKRNARSKASAVDEEGNEAQETQDNQQPPPPSLLDHCPDTTVNPYELMGITRDATEADVKRAYKKGALRWHPDKHPEDQKYKAQKAFQQLTTAYAVLSDPVRRKHYDATGKVHEALHLDPDDPWSWQPFYQHCWAEMAEGDIEAFAKEYRFSEEERRDLLMQYTTHKGNMTNVYEHVTLSNPLEDDDRYRKWIKEAIKKGEVKSYKAFVEESAESIKYRKDEAKKEAEEAEELKEMLKKSGSWFDPPSDHESHDLLALAIREKNKSRSVAFLDKLMAKYGSKSSKKGGKKGNESLIDEPSEEAFERNRKKGFEEALKRDKERQRKRTSANSKKRKADEEPSKSDEEHPVKKWNRQRKKVKRQQEEDKAAEAADPSTEEEGLPDQADLDEEIYGEPISNDESKSKATGKSKATTAKKKTPARKPASRNTKAKATPIPKAKPKRATRAVIQEEEEEEQEGNIELGSSDSDEYDENEG